jgi:predicted ribosome quality control (RQC) complex YloA/Tae2 family protein
MEEFEKKKKAALIFLERKRRKLERLKGNLQLQKQEGERWRDEEREAELLQAYLYLVKEDMKSLDVEDWEVPGKRVTLILEPNVPLGEQLKKRFKKSHKLKRRLEHSERLLKENEERLEKCNALIEQLRGIESEEDLPFSLEEKARVGRKEEKRRPFREFLTEKGLKIYVGKSDKENEELTFTFARGLDYWLHIADCPGSHVVVHVKKGEELDEESLKDALLLALYYSKARGNGRGEVIVTQCKEVSKVKGKIGKVLVKKFKKLPISLDLERFKRLASRKEQHPLL